MTCFGVRSSTGECIIQWTSVGRKAGVQDLVHRHICQFSLEVEECHKSMLCINWCRLRYIFISTVEQKSTKILPRAFVAKMKRLKNVCFVTKADLLV